MIRARFDISVRTPGDLSVTQRRYISQSATSLFGPETLTLDDSSSWGSRRMRLIGIVSLGDRQFEPPTDIRSASDVVLTLARWNLSSIYRVPWSPDRPYGQSGLDSIPLLDPILHIREIPS